MVYCVVLAGCHAPESLQIWDYMHMACAQLFNIGAGNQIQVIMHVRQVPG